MTEPPNTEALLATVREALGTTSAYKPESKQAKGLVALDAIASELETLTARMDRAERGRVKAWNRAETAEAELERVKRTAESLNSRLLIERSDAVAELKRVRAERDELLDQARADYRKLNQQQARLDRAEGALREIAESGDTAPVLRRLARAALAEIEESDVPG